MRRDIDNPFHFENPKAWDGRIASNTQAMDKYQNLKALIPKDVSTIMDVGCGDGTFLNILINEYKCIGLDRSSEALKHVKGLKIRASIDSLPLKDGCVDLVINSEVLEHLPKSILEKAIDNLLRISKKYLMIGVPYDENLIANSATCSKCGRLSNFNTHLRSFKDYRDVTSLFPKYKLRWVFICGQQTRIKSKLFVIFDRIVRGGYTNNDIFRCPYCNGEPLRKPMRRWWPFYRIAEGLSWRMRKETIPWWQVILLEKED